MTTLMQKEARQNIGARIQLGGHGILDGMKETPTKENTYRIVGVKDNGDIVLKGYRKKRNSILPVRAQKGQDYQIIDFN